MKISRIGTALLCTLPLAAGAAAWHATAKPAAVQAAAPLQYPASGRRHTILRNSAASISEESSRRAWALSEEEWSRYQDLMRGPRGLWSPGLGPIATLGIHAATEAERRRLAERFVTIEDQRIQSELAFQRAVNAAIEARYAQPPPLSADTLPVRSGERLLLFAPLSCRDDCRPLLAAALHSADTGLDIYLSGAPDDDAIRSWARVLNIDHQAVRAHRITLNHHSAIQPAATKRPRLMVRRNGKMLELRP